MSLKKKCQIVLLPTNEKVNIVLLVEVNQLIYNVDVMRNGVSKTSNQHLYITSDKEIKEGDWYIDDTNTVRQSVTSDKDYWSVRQDYKKIIAATDTSLISINEQYFDVNKSRKSAVLEQKTLPQPSQEFIQRYIKEYNKGNVISDVEVEYEVDKYDIRNQYKHTPSGKYHDDEPIPPSPDRLFSNPSYFIPKVNSDNTINIKLIKDSWSREEVIEFGLKCVNLGMDLNNNPSPRLNDISGKDYYYKWIEENL